MSNFNFQSWGQTFADAAYRFLAPFERAYTGLDNVPRNVGDGWVTIGAGLNMNGGYPSIKYAVYRQLGMNVNLKGKAQGGSTTQRAAEQGYVDQLDAALTRIFHPPDNCPALQCESSRTIATIRRLPNF